MTATRTAISLRLPDSLAANRALELRFQVNYDRHSEVLTVFVAGGIEVFVTTNTSVMTVWRPGMRVPLKEPSVIPLS